MWAIDVNVLQPSMAEEVLLLNLTDSEDEHMLYLKVICLKNQALMVSDSFLLSAFVLFTTFETRLR